MDPATMDGMERRYVVDQVERFPVGPHVRTKVTLSNINDRFDHLITIDDRTSDLDFSAVKTGDRFELNIAPVADATPPALEDLDLASEIRSRLPQSGQFRAEQFDELVEVLVPAIAGGIEAVQRRTDAKAFDALFKARNGPVVR